MTATVPQPSFLGALRNLGRGLYTRTAKFASYGAAKSHNTTHPGSRIGTNANSTMASLQRIGMAFTAESVAKNSAVAAAYLGQRVAYCSSLLTYIPGTGDTGLDADITQYLHGSDACGGYFSRMGVDCSMQDAFSRTADIETPVRGDAGMIFWRDESNDLRLLEFSADQLGEVYSYTPPRACSLGRNQHGDLREVAGHDCVYFAGRYIRGADAVAYKIYERTNSWYANARIYDAADVLYFRDPSSFRGLRGVTFFANALAYMQKGEDLLQSALSIAQRQARTSAYVFNNSGAPNELDVETKMRSDGSLRYTERIGEGPIQEYLYNGDSVVPVAPNAPGTDVIDGVESADEKAALALRTNYAFLVSATKVGGAPSRLEVEKADKEFQRIQRTIHKPQLNRIRDVVMLDAMERGLLRRPYGMTQSQFLKGRWMLPVSPSVDAFYDAKENIAMMRSGLESAQDIIAETNRDFEDVLTKSRQWAVKVAMSVEDGNRTLIKLGYKPTITAADIAQVSDNPQQAAAGENITQGKPAAGGEQSSAKLAFDESKHPRGQPQNKGEFGPGGGVKKDMKNYMQKQATHLHETAQKQGHADVNEFAANDPQGFSKAIADFQKNNPRESAPKTKNLTPSKDRAWNGYTTKVKTKLSKLETGSLGEKAVISYLKDQGFSDARTYETSRNNAPIDLLQDHELIEVKTGYAGNGDTAQQWRATIGQPGPEETKWLAKASKEDKKKHNALKAAAIMQRKTDELARYSKETGRKAKGKTITTIINPDTRTIDIFEHEGFHLRIPWNSPEAKAAYKGSFKY